MNSELTDGTPGTGYISKCSQIPRQSKSATPEYLLYACKFWINHVQDLDDLTEDLNLLLRTFLLERFILWIEIITVNDRYQSIATSKEKFSVSVPQANLLDHPLIHNEQIFPFYELMQILYCHKIARLS